VIARPARRRDVLALSCGLLAVIWPGQALHAASRPAGPEARASGATPPLPRREISRLKARASTLRNELKLNRRAQARAKGEPLEQLRAKEDDLLRQLEDINRRLDDAAPY
jgi:hypothetical protein